MTEIKPTQLNQLPANVDVGQPRVQTGQAAVPAAQVPAPRAPQDGVEQSRGVQVRGQDQTLATAQPMGAEVLTNLAQLNKKMGPIGKEIAQRGDVDFAVAQGALFSVPGPEHAEVLRQIGQAMKGEDIFVQGRLLMALGAYHAGGQAAQQLDSTRLFQLPYAQTSAQLRPVVDSFAKATGALTQAGQASVGSFAPHFPQDINDLVQWVMREAYLANLEDLKYHAQKVRLYNEMKRAVRDHLSQLRKMQSALAGVKSDDKAATDLAGVGPSSSGTDASGLVQTGSGALTAGSDPNVTSAADRASRFPDQHIAVAEFTGLLNGSIHGRTRLEDYLDKTPGAKERFLAAIPYMTTDELMKAMRYLYGSDMKLCDNLKSMSAEIAARMTPKQVLEFQTKVVAEWKDTVKKKGWFALPLTNGEFANVFSAKYSQTIAQIQAKTGNTSSDPGTLLGAYTKLLADQKAAADKAKAEAELKAAEEAKLKETQAAQTTQDPAIDSDFDMDRGDGSIDAVTTTTEPPYLMKTGEKVSTVADLETEIKNLEERLNSIGDDAQLANVDLQNMLQKQQQTLQMMSNMSKMLHDTAMAIIRKIGG